MAGNPEKEITLQEKLEILRNSLRIVGEQMRNFPADSDQPGFGELLRKQERLEWEIRELQDSIIPAPGHGPSSEYSISSANKPER